jgi:hypothetical protein
MSDSQAATAPATYTFRVRILGGFYAPRGARRIWRDLELTADQTLGDLGDAIPLAFGFDDPHLWSFFFSGKPWDRGSEYALLADDPFGDPKQAAHSLPISKTPVDRESCSFSTTAMSGTSASSASPPASQPGPAPATPGSLSPTATRHRSTQKSTRTSRPQALRARPPR